MPAKKKTRKELKQFKDFLKNYPVVINPDDKLAMGYSDSDLGFNQSNGNVKKDMSFSEEKTLQDKSNMSGIPLNILRSVYSRAVIDWKKDKNRKGDVNSFVNKEIDSFIEGGDSRDDNNDLWSQYQKKKKRRKYFSNEVDGYPRGVDAVEPNHNKWGTTIVTKNYRKKSIEKR